MNRFISREKFEKFHKEVKHLSDDELEKLRINLCRFEETDDLVELERKLRERTRKAEEKQRKFEQRKKKIFKYLKKIYRYLGELLLLIGSFITIYNLLNFAHYRYNIFTGLPVAKSYYYTSTAQFMIAIGVVLIVIGILIIRRKKK